MSNEREIDRERERRSVEAIRHLSEELAELVDLRGRIVVARTILTRNGDVKAAVAALDGQTLPLPVPEA